MDKWETSKMQSVFLYITKVLLYKTISSPFRASHLISQSKNVIIETHVHNSHSIEQINFLKTLLFRKFKGNIFDIIRSLCMHKSAENCYNIHSIQYTSMKDYAFKHTLNWSFLSFISYPLTNFYIQYMVDIDNTYNSQNTNIFSLWSGYGTAVFESFIHCILYYKFTKLTKNKFKQLHISFKQKEQGEYMGEYEDKLKQNLIKYLSMTLTNIITYPLDTIRKRQIIANEDFGESLDNITLNYGWLSLYDGIFMYLLKSFVSQICIDGCDLVINECKKQIKQREIKLINKSGTQCRICFENQQNIAFKPCGHCVCQYCKEKLQIRCHQEFQTLVKCHICRRTVTGYHKIYL
eukprot:373250_1